MAELQMTNLQAALLAAATVHTGRGSDTGAGYRNRAVTDSATAFLDWLNANQPATYLDK